MRPSPWFLSSEQRGERRVGGGGVWRQLNSSNLCREVLSARTCKGRIPGYPTVLWCWGTPQPARNSCAWLCHTCPIPMGDTSTPTGVWLWALLSTTRMNMETCIISTLAAPVRSLGGEADCSSSPPCWPLALALLVKLEHSTLLPATGQSTIASYASQHPHGPVGQPHGEAWRSLLGQPLFSGGKNKNKLLLSPAVCSRDILWHLSKAKHPA